MSPKPKELAVMAVIYILVASPTVLACMRTNPEIPAGVRESAAENAAEKSGGPGSGGTKKGIHCDYYNYYYNYYYYYGYYTYYYHYYYNYYDCEYAYYDADLVDFFDDDPIRGRSTGSLC